MTREELVERFASPGRRIWFAKTADEMPPPPVETVEVIDVTPEMAMEWIAFAWTKYGSGRNFYPTELDKIKRYAKLMEGGKWELGEGTITLDDGLITDGRHRCHAILLSHCTVKCTIVRRTRG